MPRSAKLILLAVGVLVVGVILGCAILFALYRSDRAERARDADRISNLDQWVQLTQRPDFQLLDSTDLPDYYVCVYDTGSSEVAVCYRWKHPQGGPDSRSFVVRDSDGQNLQDASRWNTTTELNPVGSIAAHQYIDGMVVPINESYRGEIQVELMDNSGAELPTRSVYVNTLRFGTDEAETDQDR